MPHPAYATRRLIESSAGEQVNSSIEAGMSRRVSQPQLACAHGHVFSERTKNARFLLFLATAASKTVSMLEDRKQYECTRTVPAPIPPL